MSHFCCRSLGFGTIESAGPDIHNRWVIQEGKLLLQILYCVPAFFENQMVLVTKRGHWIKFRYRRPKNSKPDPHPGRTSLYLVSSKHKRRWIGRALRHCQEKVKTYVPGFFVWQSKLEQNPLTVCGGCKPIKGKVMPNSDSMSHRKCNGTNDWRVRLCLSRWVSEQSSIAQRPKF